MDGLDGEEEVSAAQMVGMNPASENEQKEVMDLLMAQQSVSGTQAITVSLQADALQSVSLDPSICSLSENMEDDSEQPSLHIGEPEDSVDSIGGPGALSVATIKQEQLGEDTSTSDGLTLEAAALEAAAAAASEGAGLVRITADGQVLFTPEQAGVADQGAAAETTLQPITLADGTTAYLQQSAKVEANSIQAVELEDGTTALVSAGSVTVQQKQSPAIVSAAKFLEGQTVQLEDGTTAFIQATPTKAAAAPVAAEGEGQLQAVQLEDGTTAYLTANLFAESLDPSTLMEAGQQEQAAPIATDAVSGLITTSFQLNKTLPSRPPSERALALGEKAYRCEYDGCGRLYTTQHHLKIHERSHTGDRPFRCEMDGCTRAFATSYGLKSHIRVHTGEKPYKCPVDECSKAFKTSGDLQKHVRTHTGEKPFKCPFEGCDRAFTTSNIRKVHIRTHTGERPYVCSYQDCGKSFASATNYKNHIRIHSGEKPYVCTVAGCGKRFTEYSSLYKHHVVHTHTKPYVCRHCGKTYRQTSTLAMHKRTAHGDDSEDVELVLTPQGDDDNQLQITVHDASTAAAARGDDSEGGNLIINTSQVESQGQPTKITLMAGDGTSSAAMVAGGQAQLTTTTAGAGSTGLALADLGGQQIFVVTDPSQLEMIQQLTQQTNFVLQAELPAEASQAGTSKDSAGDAMDTGSQAETFTISQNAFISTE